MNINLPALGKIPESILLSNYSVFWLRSCAQESGVTPIFNGKDLAGWKGNTDLWSVKDGAIVGHSDKNVPQNEFLWSNVKVQNFYLTVDVKLTPADRNAGIQFRSKAN